MVYSSDEHGYWRADIVVSWHEKKSFVTPDAYPEGKEKEGKAAVSLLTLQGLALDIERMESLPAKELSQVFHSVMTSTLELLDSKDPSTWCRFWNDAPTVVGIDTEGNNISPPVLVQISTRSYCILEAPERKNGLSKDLLRLLHDATITKVFCDNFSHKDKKTLGLWPPKNENGAPPAADDDMYTTPPIVDLENLLQKYLGPVKSARGLGKIVALTMPELQVRIEKPSKANGGMKGRFANIGRFALIEQGKARPLKGLQDLSLFEQQYAALDAWCTLAVYERLEQKSLLSRKEDD